MQRPASPAEPRPLQRPASPAEPRPLQRFARPAIGLLLALFFGFALYRATLREQGVACEVCIDFQGRSACRSGVGADPEKARYAATSAACAVISGGVTEGMQCDRTPPRSMTCEAR